MSPITHFLAGWVGFESSLRNQRDRAIVCLAGLAPDLDGAGIVIDLFNKLASLPETSFYQDWHRLYGHGITAAIVFSLFAAAFGHDRLRVAIAAFFCVHLHFLCDLLGSRGSTPDDLWGLYYLAPWDVTQEIVWQGQWQLISWQNTLISVTLMLILLERASRKGYSPVGCLSPRADHRFIAVLRQWRYAVMKRFG
ncbi:hypothetical protein AGMMS49545_23740 [Betaproteobacteria bacterium]|nr:hypothetical protein AGMMS49545_23740 [Betaproteobacteria bacterium]GHU44553.1 hypothetical protein AGMMS50289_13100 [Betaproteobacteria bacterium]